jgi:hypothetical protein
LHQQSQIPQAVVLLHREQLKIRGAAAWAAFSIKANNAKTHKPRQNDVRIQKTPFGFASDDESR